MKLAFTLLFILAQCNCFSQEVKGTDTLQLVKKSTAASLHLTGTAALSKIGFSPVPSFSFDSPLVSLFLSIAKGRFSYEPAFFWGLNGKPWIIENWLKYRFIDKNILRISMGINPSLFFKSGVSPDNDEIINANRNGTVGLFGDCSLAKNLSFRFTYWYNQAFDIGTISGHFMYITGIISTRTYSKKIFVTIKPEFFYFNNTGKVDGLFASVNISVGHKKYPLSLSVQGVQRLWANFHGDTFKWNCALTCAF